MDVLQYLHVVTGVLACEDSSSTEQKAFNILPKIIIFVSLFVFRSLLRTFDFVENLRKCSGGKAGVLHAQQ
jgi:hypothetical protein